MRSEYVFWTAEGKLHIDFSNLRRQQKARYQYRKAYNDSKANRWHDILGDYGICHSDLGMSPWGDS